MYLLPCSLLNGSTVVYLYRARIYLYYFVKYFVYYSVLNGLYRQSCLEKFWSHSISQCVRILAPKDADRADFFGTAHTGAILLPPKKNQVLGVSCHMYIYFFDKTIEVFL